LQREGIEATTHEGANSQFDVTADGELVFSKQREGRFPEEAEIVSLVSGR
jgi:selT/selW/selH-like putative selenoprotein